MMKKIIGITKILLVTGIMILYGSCSGEASKDDFAGVVIRDGMASLTFELSSSYEDSGTSALPKNRAVFQPDTVRQELGDDWMLEAVLLEESQETHSRAIAKTVVSDGTKINVFAYRGSVLYKKEETTVHNGKITIHLPEGEAFRLVFYSNNSTTAHTYSLVSGSQEPADVTSGDNAYIFKDNAVLAPVSETADVMYAENVLGSITSGTKLGSIEFKHLFSQVRLELTNTASSERITFFSASTSSAYSSARVNVANGTWMGEGSGTTLPLSYSDATGATTVASEFVDIIPTNAEFRFSLSKVIIGGVQTNLVTSLGFGRVLEKGHRYTLKVGVKRLTKYSLTVNTNPTGITTPVIDPLETAGYTAGMEINISVPDRVDYNGKSYKFLDWSVTSPSSLVIGAGHDIKLTMPSSDVILTANYLEQGSDWVTTFKGWALGDLVYKNGELAIGDASEEGPAFMFGSLIGVQITTGNIIFKPEEYTGTANHAKNVPYIKNTKPTENSNSNDIAGMTDPVQGIGDICLYASQKWPDNFGHKLWRLPSNNEFKNDLGGGTYAGNPAVYTFKDATGGLMQMYCWGYWYGINNSTMWRGTYGPRWTATMSTKAGNFGSGSPAAYVVALGSGVYPNYPWGRNSAFNIRCVLFDK